LCRLKIYIRDGEIFSENAARPSASLGFNGTDKDDSASGGVGYFPIVGQIRNVFLLQLKQENIST